MKLRNKKTGEIQQIVVMPIIDGYPDEHEEVKGETSLKDFNEEWEDYEEPKEYLYIDTAMMEVTYNTSGAEPDVEEFNKEVGNYFETREEAEKAVEKLKAWRRLKDKGFKFEGIKRDYTRIFQDPFRTGKRYLQFNKSEDEEWMKENWKDLDLLFGGEDDDED